jgi:hypothetical protein
MEISVGSHKDIEALRNQGFDDKWPELLGFAELIEYAVQHSLLAFPVSARTEPDPSTFVINDIEQTCVVTKVSPAIASDEADDDVWLGDKLRNAVQQALKSSSWAASKKIRDTGGVPENTWLVLMDNDGMLYDPSQVFRDAALRLEAEHALKSDGFQRAFFCCPSIGVDQILAPD